MFMKNLSSNSLHVASSNDSSLKKRTVLAALDKTGGGAPLSERNISINISSTSTRKLKDSGRQNSGSQRRNTVDHQLRNVIQVESFAGSASNSRDSD